MLHIKELNTSVLKRISEIEKLVDDKGVVGGGGVSLGTEKRFTKIEEAIADAR